MDIQKIKFVNFNKYCYKCVYKYWDKDDEPCEECLIHPTNIKYEKPIHFKENSSK